MRIMQISLYAFTIKRIISLYSISTKKGRFLWLIQRMYCFFSTV